MMYLIPSALSFFWFVAVILAGSSSLGIMTTFGRLWICLMITISAFYCAYRLTKHKLLSIYITSGFTIAISIFPSLTGQLFFKIHEPVFRIPAFIALAIYFLIFIEIESLTALAVFTQKSIRSNTVTAEILKEIRNSVIYVFLATLVFYIMPVNSESITFFFNDILFSIILIELAKSVFNRILPLLLQVMREEPLS